MEGMPVDAGALLVRIDDADSALQMRRTEAEVEASQRSRDQTERELEIARHHLETVRRDLARYRELLERDAAPRQRVDQAEDVFEETQGRVAVLEAGIAATDGRVEAAYRELDLAKNRLAKTRVFAPVSATLLVRAIEVGEFVQVGQTVAVLVDLSRLELKVYIAEKDLGKVGFGAPVRVRVNAFPDRLLEGRVARIDQQAQFTPRDIHMPEERTRLVFGVTLALDNPNRVLKPGMPADAWLLWQPDEEWPRQLFVP